MATYYASPAGGGTGTQASPFQIGDFLALASSGDTLILTGLAASPSVYQGSQGMIQPAPNLNNITIRAENDGGAILDGQFARAPVLLDRNSGWVLEGFNAKNSNGYLIGIYNSSHNNTVRRVVVHDTLIHINSDLIFVGGFTGLWADATNNVLEDVASFGTGKWPFAWGSGSGNIFRRCWGRFEGSITQMLAHAIASGYGSNVQNGNIIENCLFTYNLVSMPQSGDYTDPNGNIPNPAPPHSFTEYVPYTHPSIWGTQDESQFYGNCPNLTMVGNITYLKTTEARSAASTPNTMAWWRTVNCHTAKHSVIIKPADYPYAVSYGVLGGDPAEPATSNVLQNMTVIGTYSTAAISTNTGWSVSANQTGATLASVTSPWTNTGNGARVCERWVNGVLTSQPLWPWPMNDRILAATTAAGAYAGPCPNCVGGRDVRTPTNVMTDIQALLGTIPASCQSVMPILTVSPTTLTYTLMQGAAPSAQTVTVSNTGAVQPLPWTVVDNETWIAESPVAAADVGTFDATVDVTGLIAGSYDATITVAAPAASNSPVLIPVTLTVEPFVETPTPSTGPGHRGVMKIKRKWWWR